MRIIGVNFCFKFISVNKEVSRYKRLCPFGGLEVVNGVATVSLPSTEILVPKTHSLLIRIMVSWKMADFRATGGK